MTVGLPSDRPAPMAFDAVSFVYGRSVVLDRVSLCVREGEFVAVVGANGSGKTTLMRLGLGLLRPASGRVDLFGRDTATFREWWKVGYVPQRAMTASALPLSVAEVVWTGVAGRRALLRRRRPEDRARFDHVVDLMGLTGDLRVRVSELSGGQQQRALIARALVTAPRLLVMDEPTTGVDADARHILRESLEHLVRVEGIAVVYVSHDPEGFVGLADRVLEVGAGAVIDSTDRSGSRSPSRAVAAR